MRPGRLPLWCVLILVGCAVPGNTLTSVEPGDLEDLLLARFEAGEARAELPLTLAVSQPLSAPGNVRRRFGLVLVAGRDERRRWWSLEEIDALGSWGERMAEAGVAERLIILPREPDQCRRVIDLHCPVETTLRSAASLGADGVVLLHAFARFPPDPRVIPPPQLPNVTLAAWPLPEPWPWPLPFPVPGVPDTYPARPVWHVLVEAAAVDLSSQRLRYSGRVRSDGVRAFADSDSLGDARSIFHAMRLQALERMLEKLAGSLEQTVH